MGLIRLASVALFLVAALGWFGWVVEASERTLFGLLAAGLACLAASFLPHPPGPPAR